MQQEYYLGNTPQTHTNIRMFPISLLVCRYSADHLFLLHYELHTEVKPIHRPSVGMLPVENMFICNISKQKNALNQKIFC